MKIRAFTFVVIVALASVVFGDIYMAGDSTMCSYTPRHYPQQGWGQALIEFMKDPEQLHNRATAGSSARSFRDEGRWQRLVDDLKDGDFVIIAFGHNDSNRAKSERYSTPDDYKAIMAGFINDARAKGAIPILATAIPHSGGFSEEDGRMHVRGGAAGIGPYVAKTVELGNEMGVPVLDLNKYAEEHLPELGLQESFRLYMRIGPGEYQKYPQGKGDGCHTRDTGAFFFAKAAVTLAVQQGLPVCEYWKDPAEVEHTPIPWGGPDSAAKPVNDGLPAGENAGAGNGNANGDWRREIMELRLEAESKGMDKAAASRWAAREYRRRRQK